MNNMALGRYRPYQTSIHKLDARVKIIGMISVIVAIFLNYGSTPLNFYSLWLFVFRFIHSYAFRKSIYPWCFKSF